MNKKSFCFYYNWRMYLEKVNDAEEIKKLILAIISFAESQEETVFDNPMTDLVYSVMKDAIARDTEKYLERCRKNAENAKARKAKQAHDPEEYYDEENPF